jgi:ribosome maturation protein Sdo1
LGKGELQLGDLERKAQVEEMQSEIALKVAETASLPLNNAISETVIKQCLKDVKFYPKINDNHKLSALKAIKVLSTK